MPALVPLRPFACAALAMAAGCTFHSTATRWNGMVGPDGKQVWIKQTTNVGLNLLIGVPVAGARTLEDVIDEHTAVIAAANGNNVRVFETETYNYWYSLPPLTWFFTPVAVTVTSEYRPSDAEIAEYERQHAEAAPAAHRR